MSTRRRANGEGSIYRRNSTGQWVAAITISGGHGTPPAKKTKHAKTRTEANRLLRQLQAEIDEGPPLDDNRITIADWCHQWCDTIAPQNAIPATVSDYYYTLDHYVLPHLGGYQLRRSLVMGQPRLELIGASGAALPRLKAMGCFAEVIQWKTRVFIPVDGTDVLARVLAEHPVGASAADVAA